MRDFLKGLDLESEMIDTIMAEHGKLVTKDKEEITNLKNQLETSNNEIKAYKELNVDNLQTTVKELQTKYDEEHANRLKVENGIKLTEAKIDDRFKDFVMSEVNKSVNDKTDFDTALKEYVEKNPQYVKSESLKKVNSSFTLNGNKNAQTEAGKNFNNALLMATGRKKV